jgi:radical SAM protein with 4Fe4S-binding SPASM domain
VAEEQRIPLLFRINEETVKKTIPHNVIFEVTRRCNLDCIMCYVVGHDKPHPEELTKQEIKDILGQLARAGTLRLNFSGGEPFSRPDFLELVEHAKTLAFNVDITSNGTLIGPGTVRQLKKLAVWQVSISLLGAKPETHDSITRSPGSFARALNALKLLKNEGVGARIKTLLMNSNFHEYREIIELSNDLGIPYTFDPTVSSRSDGSMDTLELNLANEQLRELLANPTLGPGTLTLDSRELDGQRQQRLAGHLCKAGVSFCDISWNGDVLPCMQYPEAAGNLRTQTFDEIWGNSPLFRMFREARKENAPECKECELLPLCFRCPATAALEKGDPFAAYETACQRARLMDEVRRSRVDDRDPT